MPDRPGALGAVASRIGSLGADVVGIDLVDRGAGWAIDDLTIVLPPEVPISLLAREIGEVDGTRVEEIQTLPEPVRDRRLETLQSAVTLAGSDSIESLMDAAIARIRSDLGASWSAFVHSEIGVVGPCTPDTPEPGWLAAFAKGATAGGQPPAGPSDVAAATVTEKLTILVGRTDTAFQSTEVEYLVLIAQLVRLRIDELG